MSALNILLARVIDGLLSPFSGLPPLVGLGALSLLTAAAMLLVIRATSDQSRLAAVKRAIQACIFEVRLFNDDARAMLRAMAELVRHNLTYLRLSLVPLLWMILPLGLFVAHLQFHYGYAGLDSGTRALVKVRVTGDEAIPVLEAPAAIRVETPAVWIPSLREAAWRIAVDQPGRYELTIRLGDRVLTKSLAASGDIIRRSPLRVDAGLARQFLYPAEPPLPAGSGIESIAITYPERSIAIFGWELHWLIVFLVLSTAFAFVLRSRFKVVL